MIEALLDDFLTWDSKTVRGYGLYKRLEQLKEWTLDELAEECNDLDLLC
jgi:hypothetical protein